MSSPRLHHLVLFVAFVAASIGPTAAALRVQGKEAVSTVVAPVETLRGSASIPGRETRLGAFNAVVAAKRAAPGGIAEKSLRIGWMRDVEAEQVTTPSSLQWFASASGGMVARATLVSPQAAALRVGLKVRNLPADAQLRFFAPARPDRVAGVAGGSAVNEAIATHGVYWSPVTEGDSQSVEVWLPPGRDASRVTVAFESVSHLELPLATLAKSASAQGCEEDVVCVAPGNAALARAARSVAKLVYTKSGATYMCTGTLINDGTGSQVPYIYTAAHCIDSQAVAATLNSFWFFEASQCGGSATVQFHQLSGGATLLYADAESDVALLRLADRAPDGAWFSGWDGQPVSEGAPMVALHHPMGGVKKLSLGDVHSDPNPLYLSAVFRVGATEPGSSGSGLFTQSNGEYLLRGGLRGGSSSCSNTGNMADPANRDYYSRLDLALPALRKWFGAAAAPIEDFTGLWFDTAEPGWGVGVMQGRDNQVFVTWYTYDEAGAPRWFAMPEGTWRSAVVVEGPLYRTTGTPAAATYEARRFSMQAAGSLRLEFGHGTATVIVVVDGVTITKPLTRLPL